MKSTINQVRDFGLTDDQILEIAIMVEEEGMMPACKRLQAYLHKKWLIPLNVAADTVRSIRTELGCETKKKHM